MGRQSHAARAAIGSARRPPIPRDSLPQLGRSRFAYDEAFARWHRRPGIFTPGAEPADGSELSVDAEDRLLLEHERLSRVDLEAVFAHDG